MFLSICSVYKLNMFYVNEHKAQSTQSFNKVLFFGIKYMFCHADFTSGEVFFVWMEYLHVQSLPGRAEYGILLTDISETKANVHSAQTMLGHYYADWRGALTSTAQWGPILKSPMFQ